MTENVTVLRAALTNKFIKFGAGNPKDNEISNLSVLVNYTSTDTSKYLAYVMESDFSIFWSQYWALYEENTEKIQNI